MGKDMENYRDRNHAIREVLLICFTCFLYLFLLCLTMLFSCYIYFCMTNFDV